MSLPNLYVLPDCFDYINSRPPLPLTPGDISTTLLLSGSYISCLSEHQHSILPLEHFGIEHETCHQNLSCFTSCLLLLRYTSLFYQTDHLSPNLVLDLLLSNFNHTALDILNFIHSLCKLDHRFIYLHRILHTCPLITAEPQGCVMIC